MHAFGHEGMGVAKGFINLTFIKGIKRDKGKNQENSK